MDGPHNHNDLNHTPLSFLTRGSQVEVTSDEDGFAGAWFVATVLHPPPSPNQNTHNKLVYLEYHNLLTGDGSSSTLLREYAKISQVRPAPIPDTNSPNFQLNDLVDAFHRDGWWTGVITAVLDASNFVVTFQNPPDEIHFHTSKLRIHKEWVGGRWLQPRKQGTAEWMFSHFSVGKKVEVSFEGESLRDVWFPATILENPGNNTFVVEYQQAGAGNEVILDKVTVDYDHIRPSPPDLRVKNFALLEKVDAFYDFGWWSGVITKELADNRYSVFFKHTKLEREFVFSGVRPHMEWKGGNWYNTNQNQGETVGRTTPFLVDNQIEQAAPITDNQSPVATSNMKGRVKNNPDTSDMSSPKDDETMNEEASEKNQPISIGKSEDKVTGITENPSHGKKARSKRGRIFERKTPTTVSPRKRGRLSNELKNLQASAEGSQADLVKTRTEELVGAEDAIKALPFVAEGHTKQSGPAQEGTEGDAASVTPKRKRGRPPKLRVGSPKTPVPVINESGASVVPSALSKQNVPLTKDRLLDENSGPNFKSQRGRGVKRSSARKGKRGKQRMISINNESPAQDSQDASQEKADVSLEKVSTARNPEDSAGKSQKPVSDDQTLSRWLEGKQSPTIIRDPEGTSEGRLEIVPVDANTANYSFTRTTPLWKTIESMEAFRLLPQKPHFHPLLHGVRVGAREGLAIGSMVTFSTVFERTRGLKLEDSKSAIEDCLETLDELENNGFDVVAIRKRLNGLLTIKQKHEELEEQTKRVVEKIEEHNEQGRKIKEEVEEIDRQIRELEERRKEAMSKKEKRISEIGDMEAEKGRMEEEIREVGAEFDGAATAPLCEPLVNGNGL